MRVIRVMPTFNPWNGGETLPVGRAAIFLCVLTGEMSRLPGERGGGEEAPERRPPVGSVIFMPGVGELLPERGCVGETLPPLAEVAWADEWPSSFVGVRRPTPFAAADDIAPDDGGRGTVGGLTPPVRGPAAETPLTPRLPNAGLARVAAAPLVVREG